MERNLLASGLGFPEGPTIMPDGRIVLSGPKAEIRIERDADGVPLIAARDDEDAAFGLGFVHAQERLAQWRRILTTGVGCNQSAYHHNRRRGL